MRPALEVQSRAVAGLRYAHDTLTCPIRPLFHPLCDCLTHGPEQVVRVGRLVSVIGGYALNYFHWVTEILPGLIRLRPLITADSSVRVLTHASVEWSRGILVVRG